MSSLTCICTIQVSFCQKFTIHSDMSRISGRRPKPLYSGLWPELQKVRGQCCKTLECNDGKQWRIASGIFVNISAGYKRTKGYCRADFNTPEASVITEVKTNKETGLCYRCGRPHFQNNCTNHKSNSSNKFQNKKTTWQNYKGSNYTQKFHDNRNNSNMFPTGTSIIPSVPTN